MKQKILAVAIAGALGLGAVAANAGTLLPSAAGGNVVLATEMFGTGSTETLFKVDPAVVMTLQVAGVATPDVASAVNFTDTTIKFTLSGGAVFGETIATPATMAPFLTAVITGGTADLGVIGNGATEYEFDVIAGGAIGDNTVTIAFQDTAAGGSTIQTIGFGGFKVKNLTDPLATAGSLVKMGVEWRNNDAGAAVALDTATPANIFGSKLAVAYTVTPAAVPRINVGDNEKLFTATIPGDADFSAGVATVLLGTVQLALDTVTPVMKEAGVNFDFNAGDVHVMTLTSTGTAPFAPFAGGNFFLADNGSNCGALTSGLAVGAPVYNADQNQATLAISGSTGQLTTTYELCATTDTVTQIPEQQIDSSWAIDYFNARYINDNLNGAAFNELRRNGCKVTLFNVPGIDNGSDDGYIRLTNTNTLVTGAVRGTVYAQDGSVVVANKDLVASVAPHATVVLTPEAGIANTTQLTDLTGTGRYRVVLTGAFPSCEGLGLVRNQATGMLVNMTATTNANSDTHQNNTATTVNLVTGAVTSTTTTTQNGNTGQ